MYRVHAGSTKIRISERIEWSIYMAVHQREEDPYSVWGFDEPTISRVSTKARPGCHELTSLDINVKALAVVTPVVCLMCTTRNIDVACMAVC